MRFSIDVKIYGTLEFEADDAEHARRLVDEHISGSCQAISLDGSRTDEELDDAFQLQNVGTLWGPDEGVMPELADGEDEDHLA